MLREILKLKSILALNETRVRVLLEDLEACWFCHASAQISVMLLHPSKVKVPAVSIPNQRLVLSSKASLCTLWYPGLWKMKTFILSSVLFPTHSMPSPPSIQLKPHLSLGQEWRGKELHERGIQHFPEPLSAPRDHLQIITFVAFVFYFCFYSLFKKSYIQYSSVSGAQLYKFQ